MSYNYITRDYIVREYNNTEQRPYIVPMGTLVNDDVIHQLLRDGYNLNLVNHRHLLQLTIDNNQPRLVELLYTSYPSSSLFSIDISDTINEIVKLIRGRFDDVKIHNVIDAIGLPNIDSIMSMIDNVYDDTKIAIELDNSEWCELVISYAKLLNKKLELKSSSMYINNVELAVNPYILGVNIDDMDTIMKQDLLIQAISQGNYELARYILDSANVDELIRDFSWSPNGSVGLKCMIDLSDEYPDLIESHHRKVYMIIQMFNLSYYPNYSNDLNRYLTIARTEYYSEEATGDELLPNYTPLIEMTNPIIMAELRGQVPNCSDCINALRNQESNVDNIITLMRWCINVIPASDSITNDEVLFLITFLSLRNRITNMTMYLLIELHRAKIIDLRGYKDDHKYIEFIVERLPTDKSLRVKNARRTT